MLKTVCSKPVIDPFPIVHHVLYTLFLNFAFATKEGCNPTEHAQSNYCFDKHYNLPFDCNVKELRTSISPKILLVLISEKFTHLIGTYMRIVLTFLLSVNQSSTTNMTNRAITKDMNVPLS